MMFFDGKNMPVPLGKRFCVNKNTAMDICISVTQMYKKNAVRDGTPLCDVIWSNKDDSSQFIGQFKE